MINKRLLVVIIVVLFGGLHANLLLQRKEKFCYYIRPDGTLGELSLPLFQVSFLPGKLLSPVNLFMPYDLVYTGYYDPNGYHFRDKLALIRFTPSMLNTVLPLQAQQAVAQRLGVTVSALAKALTNKQVTFIAMADGLVWRLGTAFKLSKQPLTFSQPVNLVYHLWVARGYEVNNRLPAAFSENVAMGIFQPDGVTPAKSESIAFNALTDQLVYWHAAFSPNNARFEPVIGRYFSVFWSVAVSQDRNKVHATLFLLANTAQAQDLLEAIFEQSQTLKELQQEITKRAASNWWLNPADRTALINWINTIVSAVPVSGDNYELSLRLARLKADLQALNTLR